MCPAFYSPAGGMEQIRGCLPEIPTSGDQDSRHDCRFSRCCGRNFNFFKDVFLNCPDLFETNQFQKREKRYNHFDARCDGPKQIGETDGNTNCDPLQHRIDLYRMAKPYAEYVLYFRSSLHPI